jgi:hypothetical protein
MRPWSERSHGAGMGGKHIRERKAGETAGGSGLPRPLPSRFEGIALTARWPSERGAQYWRSRGLTLKPVSGARNWAPTEPRA